MEWRFWVIRWGWLLVLHTQLLPEINRLTCFINENKIWNKNQLINRLIVPALVRTYNIIPCTHINGVLDIVNSSILLNHYKWSGTRLITQSNTLVPLVFNESVYILHNSVRLNQKVALNERGFQMNHVRQHECCEVNTQHETHIGHSWVQGSPPHTHSHRLHSCHWYKLYHHHTASSLLKICKFRMYKWKPAIFDVKLQHCEVLVKINCKRSKVRTLKHPIITWRICVHLCIQAVCVAWIFNTWVMLCEWQKSNFALWLL